jgi:hypothetical protein
MALTAASGLAHFACLIRPLENPKKHPAFWLIQERQAEAIGQMVAFGFLS